MKNKDAIKVLIVDDNKMVRDSLRLVLNEMEGIKVIGEAADGEEAIKQNANLSPDLILMDLRMPRMDGLQAMIKIKTQTQDVKIIVLSIMDERQPVSESFNIGASGYAVKEIREAELGEAIRKVNSGKYYIHPSMATHLFSELSKADTLDLAPNEIEVLRMVAEGMANDEISTGMGKSLESTKNTVNMVLDKIKPLEKVQDVAIIIRKEQG